jgi:hypothetical protein
MSNGEQPAAAVYPFLICALPDLRAVVMACRSPRSMALARVLFSDELSIQRSSAFLVVSHFLPTFLPGSSPRLKRS